MHRKIAEDVRETEDRCTLEIGAGTLNQLKHENSRPYDVVEPFRELYMNSPLKDRAGLNVTRGPSKHALEAEKNDLICLPVFS